ncbi:hypothetical protein B0H13DRAFT_1863926 [Mycena leptocephala]|nr:hypothetical protein B0H13DRAFT_1863926 [Mycena leptocephala]
MPLGKTWLESACLYLPHLTRIEEHHLQAALATSTVRIPIPGSVQLVANYAELYPSDRWLDPSTYVQCTETISEACSAALIDHDYTYYMDEADKKWLDNTNHDCCVDHERRAGCTLVLISVDEFELVMGLFEILTGPKLRQRRSLRGGHKIFPLLNVCGITRRTILSGITSFQGIFPVIDALGCTLKVGWQDYVEAQSRNCGCAVDSDGHFRICEIGHKIEKISNFLRGASCLQVSKRRGAPLGGW